ncbi:MAG: serine hydrolase domain-containing protein [Candidatus Aquilonibacter sp.]|jgi:CubicO group peptidase (beta-lactamase class C family)
MQQALVVSRAGAIVHESYAGGFDASAPHALYSGTKSFWGVAALEACADGLLDLDEHVNDGITVRMLLNLTAGYGFGGLGSAVPTFAHALEILPKNAPGTTFTYGGIPLQVFGAFFAERLRSRNLTPHDYLRERVLQPANVTVTSWRTLKDGTHPLPTGAFLTARNWLAYGAHVLAHLARYREAFAGSAANARYGLCWWLAGPKMPSDLFYASGSGGQGLYVIPSQELVAVRFSDGGSPNHPGTVKKILTFTT